MKKIEPLLVAPLLLIMFVAYLMIFEADRRAEVRYERCLKVVDSYVEQEQ